MSAYELRHTAISLQAEAGHNAWQIADWAGTSERMITEVYRHQLGNIAPLLAVSETSGQTCRKSWRDDG
jgi:integrase